MLGAIMLFAPEPRMFGDGPGPVPRKNKFDRTNDATPKSAKLNKWRTLARCVHNIALDKQSVIIHISQRTYLLDKTFS